MKNLKIVLFSVLAMGAVLTSCSKDDDGGGTGGKIEGKWILSKTGAVVSGKEVLIDYPGHNPKCEKDYTEIVAGGVAKYVDFEGDTCVKNTFEDKWTKNGNTLIMGEGSDAETSTILKLTGSELKLKTVTTFGGETMTEINLYKRG